MWLIAAASVVAVVDGASSRVDSGCGSSPMAGDGEWVGGISSVGLCSGVVEEIGTLGGLGGGAVAVDGGASVWLIADATVWL